MATHSRMFLSGVSHGHRSLQATVHGIAKRDTPEPTEQVGEKQEPGPHMGLAEDPEAWRPGEWAPHGVDTAACTCVSLLQRAVSSWGWRRPRGYCLWQQLNCGPGLVLGFSQALLPGSLKHCEVQSARVGPLPGPSFLGSLCGSRLLLGISWSHPPAFGRLADLVDFVLRFF